MGLTMKNPVLGSLKEVRFFSLKIAKKQKN